MNTDRLLHKPYGNEVTLRGQNICQKYYQPLEFMLHFKKGFRSFNTENLGSVGQRASKLPAIKVGGHKKKSADQPRPLSNQSARVRFRSRSNHSQNLIASHFAALWPKDPKFSAFKNLNPFKILSKVQEANIILRVTFALLKWPHLHRAYLVIGRYSCSETVLAAISWEVGLSMKTW